MPAVTSPANQLGWYSVSPVAGGKYASQGRRFLSLAPVSMFVTPVLRSIDPRGIGLPFNIFRAQNSGF
jgi:hypothetical protein